MAWLQRTRGGWERAKQAVHSARLLNPQTPLAGWASGEQMVYELNPVFLEIGQGGSSPMRGWGVGILVPGFSFFSFSGALGFWYCISQIWAPRPNWNQALMAEVPSINWWELLLGAPVGLILMLASGLFAFLIFTLAFLVVTDATIRLNHKRQMAYLWTGKGVIEIPWSRLTPRIESSVATAYATVKTYRGQYAELGPDGEPLRTRGIPHVFQCGQISAAEEGVRPSMEFVRLFMEAGPQAVKPPQRLLQHRPHWYAMVNFFGLADFWVDWKAQRGQPGAPKAPWVATLFAALLFPVLFPFQITNWLALRIAPIPKWPKDVAAMHKADLIQALAEEAQRRASDLTADRAREAEHPRREPVIRVNGEIVDGPDH